jgi:uncharacterized secreted protein with C-terminal beta-propeller domain
MNKFTRQCRTLFNAFLTRSATASMATSVLLSIAWGAQAQVNQPVIDGMLSNADGMASVSISKPHVFAPVFLNTDKYTSHYRIDIPLQDQAKMAQLFMAATRNDSWYIKTENGWQPWNPAIEQITPFASDLLPAQLQMQAISEEPLQTGDYEIFAGYQVLGQEFVVAPQPLIFRVASANSDTLYPFTSDSAMESYLKQGLKAGATNPEYAILVSAAAESDSPLNATAANSRVSGTNLQVGDVDEADAVKTDGRNLFTLRDCAGKTCLITWSLDAKIPDATERGSFELTGTRSAEAMYLVQQRPAGSDLLVTLSGNDYYTSWRDVWGWQNTETQLEFLDASTPAELTSQETLTIQGRLVSSRRIGEMLYLVTRFTPNLPHYQPQAYDEELAANNAELLESSSLADLTPNVVNSNKQTTSLVSSKDCYLPTKALDFNHNPSVITITAIPLSSPNEHKSTCFAGDTETVFMTTSSLYLATTAHAYNAFNQTSLFYEPQHTTSIHKFALEDGAISYSGSGQVEGHFGWSEGKKSFRMGENGDYLNVVTSVGNTWGASSSTKLTVLKESAAGGTLQPVSVIQGIGKPGERLYAARFVSSRAYLVTFRLTDPLYVVDLADQEKPRIAGELEIEGYSDYLHPINDSLIVGIGKDAIFDDSSIDFGGGRGAWYQGVKLALFDVSNPALPTQVNSIVLGKRGTESEVLSNHHGLSFLPATASQPARLAIPVQLHDTTPTRESFDAKLPNAYYDYSHTGLYSFDITESGISQAGILLGSDIDRGFVFGSSSNRSVLLGDAVFFIHQGEVRSSRWGETSQ